MNLEFKNKRKKFRIQNLEFRKFAEVFQLLNLKSVWSGLARVSKFLLLNFKCSAALPKAKLRETAPVSKFILCIPSLSRGKIQNSKLAFTVIELVIVIALIFVIASISLFNYDSFGKEIELENAAYEVALTIRTAQFAGINRTEGFESGGDGGFTSPNAYGVVFDISSSPINGLSDQSFLYFVDSLGGNARYDDSGTSGFCVATNATECINIFTLARGNYIKEICVGTNEQNCTLTDQVHITFRRPNPDANIETSDGTVYSYARIRLAAPIAGIDDKDIAVGLAGQISIQ